MVTVEVDGQWLSIRLRGWQSVVAFRREIHVALANVISVSAGTVVSRRPNGIRLMGTYLPGVVTAGSYWRKRAGWSFWSVRNPANAVDIRLRNEHYHQIVIEVDDPSAIAAMIQAAITTNDEVAI